MIHTHHSIWLLLLALLLAIAVLVVAPRLLASPHAVSAVAGLAAGVEPETGSA